MPITISDARLLLILKLSLATLVTVYFAGFLLYGSVWAIPLLANVFLILLSLKIHVSK